jgi:hypothetical protein
MDAATEKAVTETLEELIDKHGLLHVLTGLVLVCGEKADHLRTNWQDLSTARTWDRDAKTIEAATRKLCNP